MDALTTKGAVPSVAGSIVGTVIEYVLEYVRYSQLAPAIVAQGFAFLLIPFSILLVVVSLTKDGFVPLADWAIRTFHVPSGSYDLTIGAQEVLSSYGFVALWGSIVLFLLGLLFKSRTKGRRPWGFWRKMKYAFCNCLVGYGALALSGLAMEYGFGKHVIDGTYFAVIASFIVVTMVLTTYSFAVSSLIDWMLRRVVVSGDVDGGSLPADAIGAAGPSSADRP